MMIYKLNLVVKSQTDYSRVKFIAVLFAKCKEQFAPRKRRAGQEMPRAWGKKRNYFRNGVSLRSSPEALSE